jgi:hypothetical protein
MRGTVLVLPLRLRHFVLRRHWDVQCPMAVYALDLARPHLHLTFFPALTYSTDSDSQRIFLFTASRL